MDQEKEYVINPKHRHKPPSEDCTQWTVTENEEKRYFMDSVNRKYCNEKTKKSWWVEKDKETNKPLIIGKTNLHFAFIAKFVGDNNDTWHGYPVTALRAPFDIPPSYITQAWKKENIFSKPEITKIRGGKGYVRKCD